VILAEHVSATAWTVIEIPLPRSRRPRDATIAPSFHVENDPGDIGFRSRVCRTAHRALRLLTSRARERGSDGERACSDASRRLRWSRDTRPACVRQRDLRDRVRSVSV